MSYYTLAISGSNHDSSICLLKDNEIVVTYSCERISRQKHTRIIHQGDVNIIAKYTKHIDTLILVSIWEIVNGIPEISYDSSVDQPHYQNIIQLLINSNITFDQVIIDNDNHHLFHASAGYYTSGLDNAIAIIIDGMGSVKKSVTEPWGLLAESTSFFHCSDSITTVYKQLHYSNRGAMNGWKDETINKVAFDYPYKVTITPHLDIGKMYGCITRYLGFYTIDAGKTMGLAAYGSPNSLPPMLINSTTSNANLFRFDGHVNTIAYPNLKNPSIQTRKDMAYNVQRALENIFVERVASALKMKYSRNIILGGGCALNILGNSEIKKHFPDINVYCEPIAADASQSVGAALYYYKKHFPDAMFKKIDNLYQGPHQDLPSIKSKLTKLVEHYNESTIQVNIN